MLGGGGEGMCRLGVGVCVGVVVVVVRECVGLGVVEGECWVRECVLGEWRV